MNTIYKISLVLFASLILISCKHEDVKIKNNISKFLGQKLERIDSLKSFSLEKGFFKQSLKNQIQIVSYIDGTCGSCLAELEYWDELMKNPKLKNIPFVFYIHTFNEEQLEATLSNIDFTHNVIYDSKNMFFKTNKLSDESKDYRTFLINRQDKILLIGNPIYYSQIKDLYIETINKLNNKL